MATDTTATTEASSTAPAEPQGHGAVDITTHVPDTSKLDKDVPHGAELVANLNAEIQSLKAEKKTLQDDVRIYKASGDRQKTDGDAARLALATARRQVEAVTEDYFEEKEKVYLLEKQVESLQGCVEEKEELALRVDALSEENEMLMNENKVLSWGRGVSNAVEIKRLEEKSEGLEQRCRYLEKELKTWCEAAHTLDQRCGDLRRELESLLTSDVTHSSS